MKIKEKLFSVTGIFIFYMVFSLILIMVFRFFFPQEPAPLRIFATPWWLVSGILNCIQMFPALTFSALIIPFGIKDYGQVKLAKYSPYFLDMMKVPIITAIIAVVIYGLLYFLIFPAARDHESTMRFQGQLFRIAKNRAMEHAEKNEWPEADQFIALCERIWPGSPETASLKTTVAIGFDEYRLSASETWAEERYDIHESRAGGLRGSPGDRTPVDAVEALALAETALAEKRYYDAHWLATLAGRLAKAGSTEMTRAAVLASSAWNEVSALAPNSRETEGYSLYHTKRDGYEAMVSGDWIRGYYIFKDLADLTPADPDVSNFLAQCEQEIAGIAFFTDELELTVGDILTGAVFSFPDRSGGRMVARMSSLSAFPDFAYGIGFEILAFNRAGELSYSMTAPYVKILPLRVQGTERLVFLLRALDRQDQNLQWGPVWTKEPPEQMQMEPGKDEIVVDMGIENFFLMTRVRRGVGNLFLRDLLDAAKSLEDYGYIPQVFEAEILRRISEPVILLPMTILMIITGWRFRARKRPRYLAFPMLVILPMVFTSVVHIYRHIFAVLGIGMILTLGFSLAAVCFTVGSLVLFIIALMLLAAQHS
ncbi:MAG: hypothetical protein LBC60_03845 [Spirochaetaceae bacterium]|jgi:hypothetical protein|nr:hypothetical protein [Spirochaetaceae bacterium]